MKLLKILIGLLILVGTLHAEPDQCGIMDTLAELEQLEKKKEPKCYATASRLEDFMYGTPLSDEARYFKNERQKEWLERLWTSASLISKGQGKTRVSSDALKQSMDQLFQYEADNEGDWNVHFKTGRTLVIGREDKRQYATIAYSLRTILAAQQERLLAYDAKTLPLDRSLIPVLSDALDFYALSLLKVADESARKLNQYEISVENLRASELSLFASGEVVEIEKTVLGKEEPKQIELSLLKSVMDQKMRSYEAYNQVSHQLFIRNLQVYFARNRWPEDPAVATAFRQNFTEVVIAFAADLYRGAQLTALSKGHSVIKEEDVGAFIQTFIPHRINEYEDAIFFPKLPPTEQVVIESYDMDAFRDSGIHWLYLQYAIFAPDFKAYLEPDPFAAELIVENIAQFGVLILRVTGEIGRERDEKRISLAHFEAAGKVIQQRISQSAAIKGDGVAAKDALLKSSAVPPDPAREGQFFDDVTAASGIDFMHRSSDWLNRLLRSYLSKDESTGIITIPPAFGGSGVAAEDINNDGLADILLLSGLGNRLYVNRGKDGFEDVTESAGLVWTRAFDNRPGEARQPLIADFDNDGWQDIVITYVNNQHRVYKNLGNETFEDVTDRCGLGGENLVGGPATVFDFDNDGLLDVYITYFGDYIHGVLPTLKRRNSNGLPNKLFRNTGNFIFEDVTAHSGVGHAGWGQAVTHTDLDRDGLQDLIVGNDFGVNAYFKNLGDGTFKNISARIGTEKPSYTMGIGLADLNDDLKPDIYISNIVTMNKDESYILPNASTTMKFNPENLANMRVVEANDLFLSGTNLDGSVTYRLSQAVGRGYSSTGWSWDADFFDYDNDGDDDLYVLNGMNEFNLYSSENPYYEDPLEHQKKNVYIPVSTKESNVFFENDGGRLNNVSKQSGADLVGNSRSAAYFDLDNDGDLDMVLNNYHEKAFVYRNNSEQLDRNWLKIKLIGAPSAGVNRDAIGAQLFVTTDTGVRIWREVNGSIGYMSVHPKVQHVGLGECKSVDVRIVWPNGKITEKKAVSANQLLQIQYQPTAL